MEPPIEPRIFIVSDARGETCQQVIDAALVQFRGMTCETVRFADVRTEDRVAEIVARAAEDDAVVFYTLVSHETRRAMDRSARRSFVPAVDVLGPALAALDDLFGSAPESTPGLLYEANRARFDRVEAMAYTLAHDDGQRVDELGEADVVLVGVSRSSKTSTCFYLAYAGVRAANVPLVPGIRLPEQLLSLHPERVIGLRVHTSRLETLRASRRLGARHANLESYLDKRSIAREVIGAMRTMNERGWRSIDVSYRAVEEIASMVMVMRGLKRRRGDEGREPSSPG